MNLFFPFYLLFAPKSQNYRPVLGHATTPGSCFSFRAHLYSSIKLSWAFRTLAPSPKIAPFGFLWGSELILYAPNFSNFTSPCRVLGFFIDAGVEIQAAFYGPLPSFLTLNIYKPNFIQHFRGFIQRFHPPAVFHLFLGFGVLPSLLKSATSAFFSFLG